MEKIASDKPIEYHDALQTMDGRVAAIHGGTAEDLLWLLEHPPLYTAGTSAKAKDLLNHAFPVFEAGRGGEYTYHGPGQRVAYFMTDLKKRGQTPDIKKYVCDLEEVIIRTLAHFGIKGERRTGRIGIWVVTTKGEKKIAAIGVRVRHWITLHGIAINVNPDLSHFEGIVPCGLSEYGVTSFHDQGKDISLSQLDAVLVKEFESVFGLDQSAAIGNCCA